MIAAMNPHDHRHLEAARGWLGLGDWQSASDELEEITPAVRATSGVLLVRVEIYLRAGRPEMAQPVAQTLARACSADWRAHYALAQTETQLRNFTAARTALERAFALRDIRQRALADPLRQTLWGNLN